MLFCQRNESSVPLSVKSLTYARENSEASSSVHNKIFDIVSLCRRVTQAMSMCIQNTQVTV